MNPCIIEIDSSAATSLPDDSAGQSLEPREGSHSCFELDPSTSESGIPLCCEPGISSGGQEAV